MAVLLCLRAAAAVLGGRVPGFVTGCSPAMRPIPPRRPPPGHPLTAPAPNRRAPSSKQAMRRATAASRDDSPAQIGNSARRTDGTCPRRTREEEPSADRLHAVLEMSMLAAYAPKVTRPA